MHLNYIVPSCIYAALLCNGPLQAADAPASRPNVVIVIADDMNSYGFYKTHPQARMPEIDSFAKTAVTFRHAYCASPACVPSRAAVFTGAYPHSTGQYWNDRSSDKPWFRPELSNLETFPELFRRSGYETWGAGKLTHSPMPEKKNRAAWDNFPVLGGDFGPFLSPEHSIGGDKWWGSQEWTGPDSDFSDVRNADAAIEFIRRPHEKPFLLVLGLWRPHTPFTAPKRFFDLFDPAQIQSPPPGYSADDLADVPANGRLISEIWGERWKNSGFSNPGKWRRLMHGYLATTAFADWSFGRVVRAIDESALGKNTIIVVFSDNGFHMGEKNHFEKCTLWEAAALAPMAIRFPGSPTGGRTCNRPVNSIDLYPTLAELCGLAKPAQPLDGTSLAPLLRNPESEWTKPAVTTYGEGFFSARDERWRYILYPDGTEELYDHHDDEHELRNVADVPANKPVINQLRQSIPATWARNLGGRRG